MALGLAQDHLDSALDSSRLQESMDFESRPNRSLDIFTGEMEEVDYESLPTDNLSAHLVAGAAAGMMEHCFMYPVDCVKVCGCMCNYGNGVCESVMYRCSFM